MDLAILLFDGVEELDFVGPFEVLATAADFEPDLSVSLRTLDDAERVTASHGLRVEPDGTLDEVDPDLVVVPGGGWNDRAGAGAWAEAERGDVPDALARLHDGGTTVAGVCTGGMLISRAGLTEGRPAITHAGAIEDLRESGAEVIDARVVDDGDVVTAGGVTAGLDLALHLVEREFGEELADRIAGYIEYQRHGRVHVSA
ncbi:MAG TPA: DJ-1/PfpI family protein [Halobacteriales archaeon]|nr:DJ-1/PfpI family protein [Halobacteriales archaeon]